MPLYKFEVWFRDPMSDMRWSYYFSAENFAHAEEQAIDADSDGGQIIRIDLDFPNEWDKSVVAGS